MTSVKVAVRVRPLNQRELNMDSKFIIQMHEQKTTITNVKVSEGHSEGDSFREQLRTKDFTFDFSFWTVDKEDKEKYHCQETVYKALGVDVVDSGYEGYNACVFAYGQTGSGKTYTMMGPHEDPGLIPRICQELFHRMTDESTRYRTEVSYLEIYNEKVRDLLKSTSAGKVQHTLRVREHPKEGPYVQGLSKYIVGSYQEIEGLMLKGNAVRTTASTNMNDTSSRSHAIFTIVFTQATIKDGIPSEKTSKIHLVDLAGSERATATGATGQRLREGGSINKSLVSLGTVIKLLAELSEKGGKQGKGQFIPYRDSVLTWLLKDSLGGNSRTIMVTTISPADVNYAETLSALRYANRAKNIINRPTVNEDPNVKIIRELREEIDRLRAMIGGNIDNISSPKVKERLHESEARMKVLTDEWTEKWKDIASILKEQDTLALRKEGLGVVLDSTLPHLIGIDDDILSTGIMLYHLKEGTTRIGRSDADPAVDIVIAGLEVEMEHCTIENTNNSVTLTPVGESLCSVNGSLVEETTKLTQGAVILLGRTNMFRFNNPAEAAQMKKELKKSGVNVSLSRTSILSRSMSDLYKSSENLPGAGSWEMDQSHREEQEKIEELKQQIKQMEDRYHEAEEERINQQVAAEMELEKKQNNLDQAYKDLERVQKEIVKAHTDDVMIKLPKGEEIDKLLRQLDEKENMIIETARAMRDSLTQEMESLRMDNEEAKKCTMEELAKLEDAMKLRDKEMEKLDEQVENKKNTGRSQDEENTPQNWITDQKVIDVEQEQLEKMQQDFEILFRSKLEENESLMIQYEDIVKENTELRSKFEASEIEMKDRWKQKVDEIAVENAEIEEAWKDLLDQEKLFIEELKTDRLSSEEREIIEHNKEQLQEARTLLKLEEQKVASRERHVLDAIEKEMEEWESHKRKELKIIEEKKHEISKRCDSPDLDTLSLRISEKEATIEEFKADLQKQEEDLREFEKFVEKEKVRLIEEKEQIQTQKDEINDIQCKDFIKLEKQIIEWNEKLNSGDEKMTEELAEIQEERERLLLLKKSEQKSESETQMTETQLDTMKLSESERQRLEKKKKELEELQASVDKAAEELDEKVRKFDQQRDYELDTIEFEKDSLHERQRQDRINALVDQEVKRRMFEEKVQREQKRRLERDREKKEREEEIKRLKEAHHREIKQLKARYDMYDKTQRRSGSFAGTLMPTKSNPYASVMSADSDGDSPRRRSTGTFTSSISVDPPPSIIITIPTYRLQCYGSDAHYEYEVKIVIGEDIWSIYRRYSKFREFHQDLKKRIPQVGALVFPPKKFFSKNEKVAAERRTQLEFYLRSMLEICSKLPSCVLHSSQNPFLSKQVLCEFDSFFKRGLFETTKYGTT